MPACTCYSAAPSIHVYVATLDSKLSNGFYLGMVRPVGEAIRGSADHGRRNKVRA